MFSSRLETHANYVLVQDFTALVLDLAAEGNSDGVVVMSTTVFVAYLRPAAL